MIEVLRLDSFPANSDPFSHDAYHMGVKVAENVMVLHPSFSHQSTDYIIVVNTKTGERLRIAFATKGLLPSLFEKTMQIIRGG